MSIQGLWTATTSNRKTGPVPTLAVGATREQSLESCRDCGLLKGNRVDNKGYCYAQHGTPAMAHAHVRARYVWSLLFCAHGTLRLYW
jgi:hypothetical protein